MEKIRRIKSNNLVRSFELKLKITDFYEIEFILIMS